MPPSRATTRTPHVSPALPALARRAEEQDPSESAHACRPVQPPRRLKSSYYGAAETPADSSTAEGTTNAYAGAFMPSQARIAFENNRKDVERLMEIHGDLAGDTPGRKHGVEVLNKSRWGGGCDETSSGIVRRPSSGARRLLLAQHSSSVESRHTDRCDRRDPLAGAALGSCSDGSDGRPHAADIDAGLLRQFPVAARRCNGWALRPRPRPGRAGRLPAGRRDRSSQTAAQS
jgi:hypothetical protein